MTLGPVTCAQAGTLVIHFRIVVRGVRRTGPLSFVDGASQIHANAGARGDTAPAWRNGLPLPGQDAPSPRATHHHCAPSGADAVPVRCAGPPQPSFVAGWQASCSACVTAFHRSAHRIRRSRHHDSARAALFFAGFGAVPARRGIVRFAPCFAPVRRGSGGLASAREGPYPACTSLAHRRGEHAPTGADRG